LPQTFIRLSNVPEDRYSMADSVRWISAIFSRDFVDLASMVRDMVVD
jgi:hypothetical protein